jgi:F-type H+-transporting ATPase subunit a
MISKITASFAFTGLLFFSSPVLAENHAHEDVHQEESHAETHNEAVEGHGQEHADSHGEDADGQDIKAVVKETIAHHLADSYEFHITEGVGFPLPVILLDEGLKVFSSAKFGHGHSVAEIDGNHYVLHHNKIYKTDAEGALSFDEHHHPTNAKPLDFSITKNVFMILVMAVFMVVLFSRMAKSYGPEKTPKKAGRFLEPIVIYVRDEIAIPNIGEKHYKKYMSYLLTVFFFIWFLNLVGMTPLGINVTGNIAITFSLALMTFIITQVSGKKDYWMHIFWMPGVPVVLKPVMAIIELIGLFVKPFSLMIRLYANMLAGHVVLMSIIGLIFVFGSWLVSPAFFGLTLVLSLLELLVAALQAYIFTMLAALYFGSAVEEHDHH